MDIKPFQPPDVSVWSVDWTAWIILGIAVAVILVGITSVIKTKGKPWAAIVFIGGLFLFFLPGFVSLMAATLDLKQQAYLDHVAELKESLSNEGFTIITGTPSLYPNTTSDLMLQYENKNFECTTHTPIDVNTKVIFSCGEAKLNLEETKQTVTN